MAGVLGRIKIKDVFKVQILKVLVILTEGTHSITKRVWKLNSMPLSRSLLHSTISVLAGRTGFMGT